MKGLILISLWIAAPVLASVPLTTEHVDLAANYNTTLGQWQLTARDDTTDHDPGPGVIRREYAADQVLLVGSTNSQLVVPSNPNFAFLGSPGDPVWILPQSFNPQVLYLGLSAEAKSPSSWQGVGVSPDFLVKGITAGTFVANTIRFTLASFSGPGNFFLYSIGNFGVPNIHMRTDDGVSALDTRTIGAGDHAHYNWAFTAPGAYTIGLRASGTLQTGGVFTESSTAAFTFLIVPEPGVAALLLASSAYFLRRKANIKHEKP